MRLVIIKDDVIIKHLDNGQTPEIIRDGYMTFYENAYKMLCEEENKIKRYIEDYSKELENDIKNNTR